MSKQFWAVDPGWEAWAEPRAIHFHRNLYVSGAGSVHVQRVFRGVRVRCRERGVRKSRSRVTRYAFFACIYEVIRYPREKHLPNNLSVIECLKCKVWVAP